ncbi:Uncharacterized protein APZ42_033492 [Daphnia magna]|uniref:Uncharacterized protein n=1 Tax=Daphnia magna TaxID=35525 RepID=A0A164L177_9CRUS|nr:Uncharacterized protein APZ42_033492 [Daphnia magna]
MKSLLIATCVTLFLIGTCVAMDAVASADKQTDVLIPIEKDLLAMEEEDQTPVETKHWWYGHKYDWDRKKHGEHGGGHWEGKHGAWWWKWH